MPSLNNVPVESLSDTISSNEKPLTQEVEKVRSELVDIINHFYQLKESFLGDLKGSVQSLKKLGFDLKMPTVEAIFNKLPFDFLMKLDEVKKSNLLKGDSSLLLVPSWGVEGKYDSKMTSLHLLELFSNSDSLKSRFKKDEFSDALDSNEAEGEFLGWRCVLAESDLELELDDLSKRATLSGRLEAAKNNEKMTPFGLNEWLMLAALKGEGLDNKKSTALVESDDVFFADHHKGLAGLIENQSMDHAQPSKAFRFYVDLGLFS